MASVYPLADLREAIRTREQDLEEEFGKVGNVEKVTIVYDQVCILH